jgi:hypothetical protein
VNEKETLDVSAGLHSTLFNQMPARSALLPLALNDNYAQLPQNLDLLFPSEVLPALLSVAGLAGDSPRDI